MNTGIALTLHAGNTSTDEMSLHLVKILLSALYMFSLQNVALCTQ